MYLKTIYDVHVYTNQLSAIMYNNITGEEIYLETCTSKQELWSKIKCHTVSTAYKYDKIPIISTRTHKKEKVIWIRVPHYHILSSRRL